MNVTYTNSLLVTIALILILAGFTEKTSAQTDTAHYSQVFGAKKPYRIFLPEDYASSQKRYPVIYFLHGNQGTHEFTLEGIQQWVIESNVILVAWNGRSEPSDIRPYNTGYHSNIKYQVQFKDYFFEFVSHIDSTYRTLKERSQRAVMGHSMGGFMSFYLAGKFPQLIGTAVSTKGSSEFFIGYPDNHSLYLVKYMFKNFNGVRARFHNSTIDELVHLNTEVYNGAVREKDLNLDYHIYPGGHSYSHAEFKDAFQYVIESFKNPLPDPTRWHHADLYPNFEAWGYQVTSTLNEPGYIELKGVTKGGLHIRTRKWQPDGREIKGVNMSVKTAPVYKPNSPYTLFDYNETEGTTQTSMIISDVAGSVSFTVNGQPHQIGIYEKKSPPEIVFTQYKANDNGSFLLHKKENNLSIKLLNRGASTAKKIKVTLSSEAEGIQIANPVIELETLAPGELSWLSANFKVTASNKPTTDGSPFRVRFNLSISDSKGNIWKDEFDAPVFYDVPEFSNIGIDDGDSEIFGSGNGDNIADPGETIMIYQHSNRTRLYYDDPYIDCERLYDELQPDKWGDGYALSSLIHISKDCPVGHQIRFLACYEVKEWKTIKRNVTWGVFTITVGKNTDK
ncbi:MAG: alpha/beta fold hydrolase [Chitinophagaceae bacterium]|nr:alpha/beta fold hydrolase [Chitinophagaceae bacterium]